jgi:hypothetical protein
MVMSKVASQISAALAVRNKLIGLTASLNKTNPRTFADNRQLKKLDSDDWQIVFGRRGAGKTTLLATYAQYITRDDRLNSASLEINVPDFITKIETNGKNKINDSEIAQIYFDDFIRFLSDQLFKVFASANRDSKFFRFGLKSQKMRYIEDVVLQIRTSTSAQMEAQFGVNKEMSKKREQRTSSESDTEASIDAGIALTEHGAPSAQLKVSTKFDHDKRNKITEDIEDKVEYRHFKIDYAKTRYLIEELLDILGLEKLYIFLDEWSELDRTGSTEVQPYFADLIKRVFWKNPKFVFKVGAIRNHTRLNCTSKSNGIIGLELAADIFELNLDEVYSENEINRILFFEELVFRHLAVCNPELLAFQKNEEFTHYGTLHGRPVETFITHLFKTKEVFNTLVVGSGSLPRDFIEMFDSIAHTKKFRVDPPWSISDIKLAIRDHYLKNKHATIKRDDVAMHLCEKIMKTVKRNGSRLIIIKNSSKESTLLGVATLYHRRFLHDMPMAVVPSLLRNSHCFYYADLGLQFDVSREKFEDASDHDDACPLSGDEEDERDVLQYIID